MLTFYSPQGGAGKSTLAINTAIFASISGIRTLLVDMSIYGTIMSSLKIPQNGKYGLSTMLTLLDLGPDKVDSIKLSKVMKSSIVSKVINKELDVLIGANPVKMESIKEDYIKSIIKILKTLRYDLIIIDTSSELSERNLILLEESNYVVVPVIQDVSCGWKMMLFKDVMERYYLNKDKFGLVINQCSKQSGFNNKEFETEIDYKIIGEIPFFRTKYQNYINQGTLIHSKKNKKAYKCFLNQTKDILSNIK